MYKYIRADELRVSIERELLCLQSHIDNKAEGKECKHRITKKTIIIGFNSSEN